jgi:ParB family chromosome partitioning protein
MGTRRFNLDQNDAKKKCTRKQRAVEFLDKDGFSTIFRDGLWTKQRFHTAETLKETLGRYFAEVEIMPFHERAKLMLHAICRRPKPLPRETLQAAIDTEFNLDYNGVKLNKHSGLAAAIMLELEKYERLQK